MAVAKSPFYVVENFLSPKLCEQIVDSLEFFSPDLDSEGNPIKMVRHNSTNEELIFERFREFIPKIMEHYDTDYRGTEAVTFEYSAEDTAGTLICENSQYIRKTWVRTKDRDISGVLFLSDFNDTPPFDNEYEVYGGKLEFPQHGFNFQPQRGTLVMYPSAPHFINANSNIITGDLIQARIHVATKEPYLYQPGNFPGDYTTWFKDHM